MGRYDMENEQSFAYFHRSQCINFKTQLHLFSIIAKTRDLETEPIRLVRLVYPVSGYKVVGIFIQNQFVQSRNCPRYQ